MGINDELDVGGRGHREPCPNGRLCLDRTGSGGFKSYGDHGWCFACQQYFRPTSNGWSSRHDGVTTTYTRNGNGSYRVSEIAAAPAGPLPTRPVSAVAPQAVEWLIDGLIPLRAATLLVGSKGTGKSTIAVNVAARTSRGDWSDDEGALFAGDLTGPANVLIVSAEDPEHVLGHRLTAAGADLDRCRVLALDDGGVGLTLPDDIPRLRQTVAEHAIKLVILDPLVSCLGERLDSHKDHHVRRMMAPLGQLAADLDAAVLAIVHLNKSRETDLLRRISGSGGLANAARSVIAVGALEGDAEQLVMLNPAGNWAERQEARAYAIEKVGATAPDGTPLRTRRGREVSTTRIVWGEVVEGVDPCVAPDVAPADDDRRSELSRVQEWLHDLLDEAGPLDSNAVKQEARRADVSDRTLRTARARLRVVTERRGFGRAGFCLWRLPDDQGSDARSTRDTRDATRVTRDGDTDTVTSDTSEDPSDTTHESSGSTTDSSEQSEAANGDTQSSIAGPVENPLAARGEPVVDLGGRPVEDPLTLADLRVIEAEAFLAAREAEAVREEEAFFAEQEMRARGEDPGNA